MSVTLLTALLLQLTSVVLLRLGLGRTWLRRPGALLVLASVVYDGLSQVLLAWPSVAQWDTFRDGIQQHFIDEASLVMSAGMLAFTVAYLLAAPDRGASPPARDAAFAARVLDWRLLALACLPLAALTYEGRGYDGHAAQAPGTLPVPGVASTFFVIVVSLASAAFLLRHGSRWFVPVLAVQSLLLAAAGERTPVIASALGLILVLARAGRCPSRGQLGAAAVLTLVLLAAVTGARAVQGRGVFEQDSGLRARVSALGAGPAAKDPGSPGLAGQAAARLDGTSFAGAVLQAQAMGYPRLDTAAVPRSLLLAVPHAAWSSKPETGTALDPYQQQIGGFGLQRVNYLPSLPGFYAGYLSIPWLAAFLACLGAAWGLAEKRVLARCTPARLVLLAGAVQAALAYEGGLPAMLVALRPAAVIAAAAWLACRALAARVPVIRRFPLGQEPQT